MRDWGEVKARISKMPEASYCNHCGMIEAIAEIEQLQQDKAELVEVCEGNV